MNKERRKKIEVIKDSFLDLQEDLQALLDEEQEAYDNLPESLQESEKGERMSSSIENIDSAMSSLGEVIEFLDELIQ